MEIKISKSWCEKMAHLEDGASFGAGLIAIDPVFDDEANVASGDEPRAALQRFVVLSRRSKGYSIQKLADEADIDQEEIEGIETDIHYLPEPRTLYQLAQIFDVSQEKLMGLSGLTEPKNDNYVEEAVRYAAHSESIAKLTKEEQAILDKLVSVLSKK